jgi:hypothetical protein
MAGRAESNDSRKAFVTASRSYWPARRLRQSCTTTTIPKGHHRHIEGAEEPYQFGNVDRLIADFMADVLRLTGARA